MVSIPSNGRRRALTLVALALALVTPVAACASGARTPLPSVARLDDGRYRLSVQPGQLLLSGQGLYFAPAKSQRIYHRDLESLQMREIPTQRFYPDGIVDSYRLSLAGDRLVYLEVSAASNGRSWTLAAHHLKSGETVAIDQAQNDEVGWPGPEVAADGDWVVWLRKEATGGGPRSLVRACHLPTGQTRLIGEPLDATQEAWSWPNLHAEQLVVERDQATPTGPQADVYLIDLASGGVTPLSGSGQASEPALGGRQVVWKGAHRYAPGPLVVYDLESRQARTLDLEVEYPHSGDGVIVGWARGVGLVRIDAATGSQERLAPPQDPAPEVAVDGRRVAWAEAAAGDGAPTVTLHVRA